MKYTKEIFDILSRGWFISTNSVDPQKARLFEAIEEDFDAYYEYFKEIGFNLEGGDGYYYFSRQEKRVDLENKLEKFVMWIDRIDFLKVFNSSFGPGFSFRKSNILEQFSNDIELKEKASALYTDLKTLDDKMDNLIKDLERQGFIELENELDGTYKVTSAFHYIEEMMDCLTIIETGGV